MSTDGHYESIHGHPDNIDLSECPVCRGRGQVTGPKSIVYKYDPTDPFNIERRDCSECAATGVVTTLRAAAILADSEQHVQRAINSVMGLPGDPRDEVSP